MKLLVSKLVLQKAAKAALDANSFEFTIDGDLNMIVFDSGVTARVNVTSGYNDKKYKGRVLEAAWQNIYDFLKGLEEQPIVMTLTEHSPNEIHLHPDIEFSQFVKRFKIR